MIRPWVFLFAAVVITGIEASRSDQITCTTVGGTTICDNGTTIIRSGGTTIIQPSNNAPKKPLKRRNKESLKTCVRSGGTTTCF